MAKLTDKQRDQRRRRLQDEALESVAARGQFNFRLDGKDIKRLYELAGQRKKPVSAMVREWVLERLEREESNTSAAPTWAQELSQRLTHTEVLLALFTLGSSHGRYDEALRSRIRDYLVRHCDVDNIEELRGLLRTQ
ncbi:MAG: ribbon-helix-helix protein, CopG family [Candidatus Melainabacteria bacterium]|nr:ribbon-helix-helix protein, CopG family [Candidatus Melainabacteria bacterium]